MAVLHGGRFRYVVYAILCCLNLSGQGLAQTATAPPARQGEFVNRVYKDAAGEHKYVVFVPAGYSTARKWPTILFLHGACNRGTDGRSQLVSGMAPSIRLRQSDYPFLVVFPQCEDTASRVLGGWTDQPDDAERALKILDEVERDFSVDTKHECLVGLSMGGSGAWAIASRTRDRWAALVPVSAMARTEVAAKVARIPTWVFHAANDPLVATHIGRDMVEAVRAAGGRAYFSEVTKRAHDLSNVVFTQTALTDWLLDPSRDPNLDLAWTEPKGYSNGLDLEVPFLDGADMPRAIRFRVCKDVLNALCYSAPQILATHPLAGYVGGMHQSTKVGGILPIDVTLSGLHYQGHIEQVRVIPKAPNRLIIQAGLRNVTMTVSNSQLNGKLLLSATAGPMNVVIGHRAPVWLTIELHPKVENRNIRLNLAGVDFQIPPDNWYVTQPSGVHVRGLPFLNERVSDGLVDGVYTRKGEIERQVINNVPGMVQAFEAKLNDAILKKTIAIGQISMPMWQPRMKTYPEEILIDDDGVTMISGIVMCALGHVPKDFKMRTYPVMQEVPTPIKTGVEVDVAESVVPAWSDLVVAGGVNQFNVFDFTPVEYHQLADRDFLQAVIPDLKRFGDDLETMAEFRLRDPIRLLDPKNPPSPDIVVDTPGNSLTLSLSSVPLFISMRKKGEVKWTPVGELDLDIVRDYAPYVRKSGFAKRGPKFAERSQFRIKSKWSFAKSYAPVDSHVDEDRFVAQVLSAREAAQLLEGVKPDSVQDVVLNGVPLRIDNMDWVKKHVVVQYQLPGLIVRNDSDQPLTYEVRGPDTGWSQPRTLPPGESDEYRVPYPLTWRRRLPSETQFYTLPLGREFSFRTNPEPGMVLVKYDDDLVEEKVVPR